MKRRKILTTLVLGLVFCFSQVGNAAPMGTAWTYQGRLMDANGPSDGVYDFLFKLYNEPNGAGYQLPPTYDVNDTDVIDGYFTVELDFGSNSFNGNAKWLEILVRPGDSNDVNDFVILSPRQEVTPTPYALQTRGIFVDNAEDVGIGTTHPVGKLHVDGGKAADDMDGNDIIIKAQEGGDRPSGGISIGGYPGGDIILLPGDGGVGPFGAPGPSGKVGIGTENPEVKLDVRGNIEVDQKIQAHDEGGLHLATDEGTTRILISDTGEVGIGTNSPTSRLHIEQSAGAWDEGIRLSYGGHEWDFATDYGGERLTIARDQNSTDGFVMKNGNIGIGTSNPESRLHLEQVAGAWDEGIRLSYGDHEWNIITDYGGERLAIAPDEDSTKGLVIHNGNAGLGTSSPGARLHVNQSAGAWGEGVRVSYGSHSWDIITDNGGERLFIAQDETSEKGLSIIDGKVGIGTPSPGANMDVKSSYTNNDVISALASDGSELFNVREVGTGDGIVYIKDRTGAEKIRLSSYGYSSFKGGNVGIGDVGVPLEKLVVRGNILVKSESTGADVLELGQGLDYAEGFDVTNSSDTEPGTVLVIDSENPGKLRVSQSAYDSKVAGIVAGANGVGSGVRLGVGQFDYDVALAGRVYCKVDATEEAVQAGDQLTTSGTTGHAMKASDYDRARGAVLGKAMESLPKGQKGQILVLVTLQ